MDLAFFNINDGFCEAIVRGFKSGLLTAEDYRRLAAADTLEDVRSALEDTDYGSFLQDEPSPLKILTIVDKCKEKLAQEFDFLRGQATHEMAKFLDFVRIDKMIDNVVLLIQGSISNKPPKELLGRVDPLGWFEEMKTIPSMDISEGYDELYKTILVDTPIAPYFREFLMTQAGGNVAAMHGDATEVSNVLSEIDMEIMKNILKKAWLEDFYQYVVSLGGNHEEVCGHILKMEADFRVLMVTLNALNSPLGTQQLLSDRNLLYPSFGYMYPEGTERIRKAWNEQTVRATLEPYGKYSALFEQCKAFYDKEQKTDKGTTVSSMVKSIEDLLYVENVNLYELAFEQQYHYGVFYAWVKLREQEIRNIEWICNMIAMGKKEHAEDIVPIFAPRIS